MNNSQPDVLRTDESKSLKDYLNLLRVNIVPIVLISLTSLIISIVYSVNAINIYKSTTVLKLSKPKGSILESPLMPEFSDFGSDRFIANEIEILKSYSVREKVAKTLIDTFNTVQDKSKFAIIVAKEDEEGAVPKLKNINAIIKAISGVSIDQKRGLDIVEISVESPSPYEASLIANVYADAYRSINLYYNRQQMINVKDFLEDQRREKLNDLNDSENRLRLYQEKGGIVALPEQANALIGQLTDFESQKNAAKIELTIAENNLKEYRSELEKQNPRLKDYLESLAGEPYFLSLQTQIAQLKTQKDIALANNPIAQKKDEIVREFDTKIADLQAKVDLEIKKKRAGIFASSPEEIRLLSQKLFEEEVKYQSVRASYTELNKIVNDYERKFNQLPNRIIDLARLQREQSAFEKLYLLVEQKYQESVINEQSTPGNVLIVDQARIPITHSKPNRTLIVIVGFVLGLGMAFGFAFVRAYFDTTIKTPEDIQKRNINVLAWIPQIEGVLLDKEYEFIVYKKPNSIPSEAFRALRTRIQFSKIEQEKLKTILVTSSTPQEGKTTISVNLAGSFANSGKKTLILDCDLRKPRLHTVFKAKRYPGFVDHFFGQATIEEITRKSDLDNLYYITAGTIPPNPSEILGSSQMQDLLVKLKEEYDMIVIDSPPIIAVTDSEILSSITDGTLLVTSANTTEIELMKMSVDLLSHERATFLGVILNNFTYRSGYGSYYKYYYYYSKPKDGKDKSRNLKTLKTS